LKRIPYPEHDNRLARIVAPVEIDNGVFQRTAQALSHYGSFEISEYVPHFTVVSGDRKPGVEKSRVSKMMRRTLLGKEECKLAKFQLQFFRLNQFQWNDRSVIYLEPEEPAQMLRMAQQLSHSVFWRLTERIKNGIYHPRNWTPHLTLGKLREGRISRDELNGISVGLPLVGTIEELYVLTGPNELETLKFPAA